MKSELKTISRNTPAFGKSKFSFLRFRNLLKYRNLTEFSVGKRKLKQFPAEKSQSTDLSPSKKLKLEKTSSSTIMFR